MTDKPRLRKNTGVLVAANLMAASLTGSCNLSPPQPDVLYVNVQASAGGDGLNWASAFNDLQDAMAFAAETDSVREIWVAAGAYHTAAPGGSRAATFRLRSGLAVYGGFEGDEASREKRDPLAHLTILSGDLERNDDDSSNLDDNALHVVTGSGTDESAILDGFTVIAGNANGIVQSGGAGLLNDGGSPTISQCRFTRNTAAGNGGAVANVNGHPMFADCAFEGNSALGNGGAAANSAASAVYERCTFQENSATLGGAVYNIDGSSLGFAECGFEANIAFSNGGAMHTTDCTFTVTNTAFKANFAATGGALYCASNTSPAVTDCRFEDNITEKDGAAVANIDTAEGLFERCVFVDNVASGSGGAVLNTADTATLYVACTFAGNSSQGSGGAMFNFEASPALINCMLSGNSGAFGGALVNRDGSDPQILGTTFSGNSASSGAAIFNIAESSPVLTNCIFWGNIDVLLGADFPIRTDTGAPVVNYTCIQGGWTGEGGVGVIDQDPLS